ncbi:MAG: hypothetical protein HRU05_09635 [Oceanospirillaceae bacterium]|nr:hypothetical protein [Oceanospirillaceae bacterium]
MQPVKGGRLCKAAVMLCKDPEFWHYLDLRVTFKSGCDIPLGTHNEQDAKDWILKSCGHLTTRSQIDHCPTATQNIKIIFNSFNKWRRKQPHKRT